MVITSSARFRLFPTSQSFEITGRLSVISDRLGPANSSPELLAPQA